VRRSIGHSHVLSPKRRHEEGARAVAVRLVTKLGTRARHLGYMAGRMTLSIRLWHTLGVRAPRTGAPTRGERWGGRGSGDQWWETDEVIDSTNDTMTLVRALATMWDRKPPGGALKIGVTLTDLTPAAGATGMLFGRPERKYSIEGGRRLSKAMDRIAKKFGADAVYPGSMHDAKSSAPRRIAFGSIPDLDVPDVVESGEQDE
jgi:DNA polymerase-4